MSRPLLTLASGSPRRQEILESLGISFAVVPADIDETPLDGESPGDTVVRVALAKARAVAAQVPGPVLGGDTEVVLNGEVFGKPVDEAEALAMLAKLSGKKHTVLTAVALVADGNESTALSTTEVLFRELGPDEARRYWQSGEPRDKAGAYAIQGLGGVFVEAIEGSYSGVVGLPVFETAGLLREAGIWQL